MARQQLILDRYRVIDEAGAGGYGTVQHAYDTRLKRDVAIKCIKLSEADVARARLLAMEARVQNEMAAAEEPELLPWEEDSASPDGEGVLALPSFPDDPDFLDAREGRPTHGGAIVRSWANAAGAHAGAHSANPDDEYAEYVDDDVDAESANDSDAAPDELDDPDADDLFDHIPGLEEARTAAHLNDANIVTVYDCEVHGSTAYVIMEYVEGKTLARVMRDMGDEISLDVIAAVFTSVAHALEVAHDNDVLHLDIKPENVIVNKKGVVKVTDFGLATLMDAGGRATTGGGTIGYMPPEQMRQEDLDVRTDEWALASLTYEMLSGSNPFRANDLREAEQLIDEAELVLPSLCWDVLDAAADDIVFDALDPDLEERYASVAAFAEALTPLLGSARAGKRALAAAVSEEEEEQAAPSEPREPLPPLIDRLGPRGAAALARVLAVASTVMTCAVALVNMRLDASALMGLASSQPVVFWALMVAAAAFAAWRPAFGALASALALAVMLVFNQVYALAPVLLVVVGAWWWFVGCRDDGPAAALLAQPLFGSFGMAALAPVAAGALLDVREATATAACAVVTALAFATLGSGDLLNWNIAANALTAANPAISGGHMGDSLMAVLTSPATWCVAASWVLAAGAYSLFCLRGTRAFDIAGSVVCAALLVAGVVVGAGAENLLAGAAAGAAAPLSDAAAAAGAAAATGAATWLPDPLALAGALVPGAVGIVLAVMSVPDRVRLAEGEW